MTTKPKSTEATNETESEEIASYVVKHAYVGEWPEGTVLSTDDLKGIDVQRLLNLEAIEKVKA